MINLGYTSQLKYIVQAVLKINTVKSLASSYSQDLTVRGTNFNHNKSIFRGGLGELNKTSAILHLSLGIRNKTLRNLAVQKKCSSGSGATRSHNTIV